MGKIDKLKKFLQEYFPNYQAFNNKGFGADSLVTVYDEDGIKVDWCQYYSYIEVFGLTDEQFLNLIDENGDLKTF